MTDSTNAIGQRVLIMYADGRATREQLDAAYAKGWISDTDYQAAIATPVDPTPAGA